MVPIRGCSRGSTTRVREVPIASGWPGQSSANALWLARPATNAGKCRIKKRAIHDRRLLAGQDLVLVFDLADIEVIAQQIVQRTAAEWDAAAGAETSSCWEHQVTGSDLSRRHGHVAQDDDSL